MNTSSKRDLQIVQAFSSADLPEQIIRESNIESLIHDMISDGNNVRADSDRLERLRNEKKKGNFLSNWWNDRGEKVQDAQIDLNKSIGRLTEKSSRLLIVNTAISKVLNDQQNLLLAQQETLKKQTDTLEKQNRKILNQQELLEIQQTEINRANQGLMEAKGLTQEQAQQLVGCVKLVKECEGRIQDSNQALKADIDEQLSNTIKKCLEALELGFSKHSQRYDSFENQLSNAFSNQSQQVKNELDRFNSDSIELKTNLDDKLKTQNQAIIEKLATQDTSIKKLNEESIAQQKAFQHEIAYNMDIKMLSLQGAISDINQKRENDQLTQAQLLQEHRDSFNSITQRIEQSLADKTEALSRHEDQIKSMHSQQLTITKSIRTAFIISTSLALVSLGWQIATHFR